VSGTVGLGARAPKDDVRSEKDEVLDEARDWIGTPYRHQGSVKGVGCDCLGLVRGVWRALYGSEPEALRPYSADWAEAGAGDGLLEAARRHFVEKAAAEMAEGDLILFRWKPQHAAKHAAIISGPDTFIHAYEGHSVLESHLVPQWKKRIAGVFAFPPLKD
jgi:NlpC/P60 family putative phage cell wall peptidase